MNIFHHTSYSKFTFLFLTPLLFGLLSGCNTLKSPTQTTSGVEDGVITQKNGSTIVTSLTMNIPVGSYQGVVYNEYYGMETASGEDILQKSKHYFLSGYDGNLIDDTTTIKYEVSTHRISLPSNRFSLSGQGGRSDMITLGQDMMRKDHDLLSRNYLTGSRFLIQNPYHQAVEIKGLGWEGDGETTRLQPGSSLIIEFLWNAHAGSISVSTGNYSIDQTDIIGMSWDSTLNVASLTIAPGANYTLAFSTTMPDPISILGLWQELPNTNAQDFKDFDLAPNTKLLSKADIETIIQEQVADLATGNSYLPLDLPQIINQEPGLLTFDLTLPPGEHKYYLATRDNQGMKYVVTINAKNDKLSIKEYQDYIQIDLNYLYPLKRESLTKSLDTLFGTGGYDLEVFEKNATIVYYIPPKTQVKGAIEVENIFSQKLSHPIDFFFKDIPKQFKTRVVQGAYLSLMPRNGYRGDNIEFVYKNVFEGTLKFQRCNMGKPDYSKSEPDYLESYVFHCSGPIFSKALDFNEGSKRRKTFEKNISLPPELADAQFFKVFLDDVADETNEKYFMRSNIGLITKVTNDSIYLRPYSLDKGKKIETGEISIYDKHLKLISTQNFDASKEKYAVMAMPQSDDRSAAYFVVFEHGDDKSFVTLMMHGGSGIGLYDKNENYVKYINLQGWIDNNEVYTNAPRGYRGSTEKIKIYGYTDRALYKPGDDVFFAGFARDLMTKIISQGTVTATLYDLQGNNIARKSVTQLDEFGGFEGKMSIPQNVALGNRYISYEFASTGDQTSTSYYSHELKVEEYQKPTFFITTDLQQAKQQLSLNIAPEYYFGSPLQSYDLTIEWSIDQKEQCGRWCWWGSEDPYYYNAVMGLSVNTGGTITQAGLTDTDILIPLTDLSLLADRGSTLTLKAVISIKDLLSDETQYAIKYLDIAPQVSVGINGSSYEYYYSQKDIENVQTILSGDYASVIYQWYWDAYDRNDHYGVDNNRYYADNTQFALVTSGTLKTTENRPATLESSRVIQKPGRYLLRVIAYDQDGETILGESQKMINYYKFDREPYEQNHMGDMQNNYKLIVNIDAKTYKMGEKIQINIEPYVKGASVLITAERGDQIIESFEMVLDGSPILIPVRESFLPNVNFSVIQIIGEQIALSEKRKEPRFFIGYANANIDESSVKLNIAIKTDKETYQPGEMAKVTITTTDREGKPIDTRLSVAIVDEALTYLYDIIKEPIPYYYNKVLSSVNNYTNMKLLYQTLRVFVAGGEKGGGGGGGRNFSLREQFKDLAYRKGALYSKNGKVEIETKLPDNLTTRMIDAIAVSKNMKLGTARKNFTTSKPLLIDPNPPLFLTLGDQLAMPIKVVTNTDDIPKDAKILVQGKITTEDREWIMDPITTKPNSKAVFTLKVPDDVFDQEWLTITFATQYKDYNDAFLYKIPLRTQGFLMHDFLFSSKKSGSWSLDSQIKTKFTKVKYDISTFPIEAFSKVFGYLLHYPYGCTEQLMSSLYPIITAHTLTKAGLLGSEYIKNDEIKLSSWSSATERTPIKDVIADGLDQIFKNQQADGGMGLWANDTTSYPLSAYVYGAIKLYEQQGFTIPTDKLASLEYYLESNGGKDNVDDYLYFLWNQSWSKAVDLSLLSPLVKTPKQQLFAFAIAVNNKDWTIASTYYNLIKNQNNTGQANDYLAYNNYVDKDILTAVSMRALVSLLSNDATGSWTKEKLSTDLQAMLMQLLQQRDQSGLWTHSTQKNVQITLALGDYLLWKKQSSKSINCTIHLDNEQKTFTLTTGHINESGEIIFSGNQSASLAWNCDDDVLVEGQAEYLLKNIQDIQDSFHGVRQLSLKGDWEGVDIGEKVTLEGFFEVEQEAKEVAVEFFVPSTIKLLDIISQRSSTSSNQGGWGETQSKSFEIIDSNNQRQCYPTHSEVRFDRLFLYYNTLPAGQACRFAIKGIKAYEGEVNVMPTRLREMYKPNVRATSTWKEE